MDGRMEFNFRAVEQFRSSTSIAGVEKQAC
jgi:hypothetical protein